VESAADCNLKMKLTEGRQTIHCDRMVRKTDYWIMKDVEWAADAILIIIQTTANCLWQQRAVSVTVADRWRHVTQLSLTDCQSRCVNYQHVKCHCWQHDTS